MLVTILDYTVFKNADWNLVEGLTFASHTNKEEAEILAVGFNTIIDNDFMLNYPNCKYILSPTTAVDHITTNFPVKIIKLKSSEIDHINASAEFAFLLILSVLRQNPFSKNTNRLFCIGHDLSASTVGILGHGRIGKKVEHYVKSFGGKCLIHDKINSQNTKEEVLKNSDVILLSISALEENRHFMGKNEFSMMRQGAYFVNIARGFLVDESALLYYLENAHLGGAALDVVDNYHLLSGYEKYYNNLIITPHIAGSTVESQKLACNFVLKELSNVIKGC